MAAVPGLPPGYRLIALEEVASTNDVARDSTGSASAAQGGRVVVWAKSQTAGRGRRGRTWSSPSGNAYVSILLPVRRAIAEAAQLSLVAALALVDALSRRLPSERVSCKWPNDILVDGRKCAGILLETVSEPAGGQLWVIVGCGVNVRSYPRDVTAYPTTSLYEAGATGTTVVDVVEDFVRAFDRWEQVWWNLGLEPIRQAWIDQAHGLGQAVTVRRAGRTITGRFAELDAAGALVVVTDDGTREHVTAGDVFFEKASRCCSP